ncbi:MAG: OmpA family protein, partial [Bacteroidetes bacterium]|nr:OmpA family protein [Bacteroidota bacterium]
TLLKEMPRLKVEISSHTDSKGSDQYNQVLSENRAKSVVDYLINAGIDKSRLIYKGYGESQPIATNETDEGRQLNRRTEFKILAK